MELFQVGDHVLYRGQIAIIRRYSGLSQNAVLQLRNSRDRSYIYVRGSALIKYQRPVEKIRVSVDRWQLRYCGDVSPALAAALSRY